MAVKAKIKLSGRHAEQYLAQVQPQGFTKPSIEVKRPKVPAKKR